MQTNHDLELKPLVIESKDDENQMIKFPKLELKCVSSKNEKEIYEIILTPNSINGVIKNTERFSFGRAEYSMMNDYNFPDDSIGNKQFEVYFDKC